MKTKFIFFIFIIFIINAAVALDTIYPAKLLSVTDGDTIKVSVTIWPNLYQETSVRIYGIDTPEIHGECEKEKELAIKARDYVDDKLKTADNIYIQNVSNDKYGNRVVADVLYTKDNSTFKISEELIKEELATEYFGKTKDKNWCE